MRPNGLIRGRFHNIASSTQARRAATTKRTQREGIPPAPLQHPQPPPAHAPSLPAYKPETRARRKATTRTTCKQRQSCESRAAHAFSRDNACCASTRARCRQAPIDWSLPSPALEMRRQCTDRVNAKAASGCMGTRGVVARARPSRQALERSPAALADPAPGPGTLRHEIKRRRSWQQSHRES